MTGNSDQDRERQVAWDVLRLNPSMESAVHAVAAVERSLEYPIEGLRAVLAIFDGQREIAVGERTVTAAQVERFLPEECFPIDDREELIAKLVMAFERERFGVIAAIPPETRQEGEAG